MMNGSPQSQSKHISVLNIRNTHKLARKIAHKLQVLAQMSLRETLMFVWLCARRLWFWFAVQHNQGTAAFISRQGLIVFAIRCDDGHLLCYLARQANVVDTATIRSKVTSHNPRHRRVVYFSINVKFVVLRILCIFWCVRSVLIKMMRAEHFQIQAGYNYWTIFKWKIINLIYQL